MKRKALFLFVFLNLFTFVLFSCATCKHDYVWNHNEEQHFQICNKCSKVINKSSHEANWQVIKEETCKEAGLKEFRCETCNYVMNQEIMPNGDHEFQPFTTESSCTKDTIYGKTCLHCDEQVLEYVDSCTGHHFSEWEKETENTCSQTGLEKRVCLNEGCGLEEKREVKKVSHDFTIEQTITRDDTLLYECKNCGLTYTRHRQDENCTYCDSIELFNQSTNFTFNIICFEDEQYIKEHLKIYLNFLDGTQKASELEMEYSITLLGDGLCQIKGDYDSGETYIAKLNGELRFEKYLTSNIVFTTTFLSDNIVEFNDELKFINDYISLDCSENSECFYLTVLDIGTLEEDDIICIGEINSIEELKTINLFEEKSPAITFGKVQRCYKIDGGWKIILTYPQLDEIFKDLDFYEKGSVDLEKLGVDIEEIKPEVEAAFIQSEEFINFLAVYHETVETYAKERGYDSVRLNKENQKGLYISSPEIKISGTKFSIRLNGGAETPITVQGKNIGNISVDFSAFAEVQFIFSLNISFKKKWIFITGVKYIDIQLKQLDSFDFDFKIKMNIEYSSEETEEKDYVYNTDPKSHKLHVKNCRYLENVQDKSKLESLNQKQAYIKYHEGVASECQICLPIEKLNRKSFVINADRKIIHCLNCNHVKRMNFDNAIFSSDSAQSLNSKGYSYCSWCQPELKESLDFEEQMLETLKYENWKEHIEEIKQWAKNSNVDEYKPKGIRLGSVHFNVAILFTVNLDISLIINFKLEASLDYKYQIQHELVYGMRIQDGRTQTYNSSKELNSKNELDLMGRLDVTVGVQADLYVSVIGLSKLIRAGFTAEVGAYASASGVVHQGFEDKKNYGGAYLEMGIYIQIDAYYKVFGWNGNLSLIDTKFPILQFGYDKVYYAFVNPIEYLDLSLDYTLEEEKFLTLEFINVRNLNSGTEVLHFNNNDGKYSVIVTLSNGEYCRYENGRILINDSAPCQFEDILRIQIVGDSSWKNYIPNNATFCLDDYLIPIYYYSENRHNFIAVENKPADCFSDGYTKYSCEVCNQEREETEPQLSHQVQINKGHAATCWENGKTDEMICLLCNSVLIESSVLPVLGHKFNEKGICLHCGNDENDCISIGLEYKLAEDGKSYSIVGNGQNTDSNLVIPEAYLNIPVTTIERNAFAGSSYVSISIGNGIKNIEENAFANCNNLRNLKIGKEVTEINSNPFRDCSSLEYIIVDSNNTSFVSENNCILSANKSTLFVGCKMSIIPEGVTNIRLLAFCGCSDLNSIVIPSTVDTLQPQAFLDCTSLEIIILPNSLKYINYKCFENCPLKNIYYAGNSISWDRINIDNKDLKLEEIVYFYSSSKPTSKGNYWYIEEEQIKIWNY
ncbi:MAG: leucine-rich repeat domain-containing protein [Anaeroplasmataceae bacterium]|nr:leucine-rich repeat domain-containing protein [Anaeroplasmataceae bacterium]